MKERHQYQHQIRMWAYFDTSNGQMLTESAQHSYGSQRYTINKTERRMSKKKSDHENQDPKGKLQVCLHSEKKGYRNSAPGVLLLQIVPFF